MDFNKPAPWLTEKGGVALLQSTLDDMEHLLTTSIVKAASQ